MIVWNVKSDVDIGSPGPKEETVEDKCREEKGEEEQVGEAAQ